MKIHGLQKLTLLDFPGRTACTVFLAGCELRCPFCHNADLLDPHIEGIMEDTELLSFLKKRQGLLDGVAFTGGEPMMNPGLPDLIRSVHSLGYLIKLDTNGCHPETLSALLQEGLVDYVAMDIKNSPERYAKTCGLESVNLGPIQKSIDVIRSMAADYEFRTTVVAQLHDSDSFYAIGAWLKGARRFYLQAFMDRDSVPYAGLSACSREEMYKFAEILRAYIPQVDLRGIA